MKISIKALTILLALHLSTLTGCSLIIQPKLAVSDSLKGIPTFDPNDYNCSIDYETVTLEDGRKEYTWQIYHKYSIQTQNAGPIQLKYAMFASQAVSKCEINNRTYPILFDTGNPDLTNITVAHIRENQLPTYPFKFPTQKEKGMDLGVAMIEELKIGDLTMKNLPAEYRHYHTGYFLLGLAEIGQDKKINIPLTLMQQFKYITFDNIKKRMEFSLKESFQPNDPTNWKSYPLITEDDRIYIETTLEGVPVKLMIDTGCGVDMLLTKNSFDTITEKQPKLKKAWKLHKTAFAPLSGGDFPCQSHLVSGLTFDKHKHKLTTIIVTVDEGNLYEFLELKQFDGLLGFPFFDDTIMTLDFEKEKMVILCRV